jgi:hypothetical protein
MEVLESDNDCFVRGTVRTFMEALQEHSGIDISEMKPFQGTRWLTNCLFNNSMNSGNSEACDFHLTRNAPGRNINPPVSLLVLLHST